MSLQTNLSSVEREDPRGSGRVRVVALCLSRHQDTVNGAYDHPVIDTLLAPRIGRKMRRDLKELRVRQPELIPNSSTLPFGSREITDSRSCQHPYGSGP